MKLHYFDVLNYKKFHYVPHIETLNAKFALAFNATISLTCFTCAKSSKYSTLHWGIFRPDDISMISAHESLNKYWSWIIKKKMWFIDLHDSAIHYTLMLCSLPYLSKIVINILICHVMNIKHLQWQKYLLV